VVVPAETPVTSPVVDTVAIAVLADCHVAVDVTFSTVPSGKTACAENCDFPPTAGDAPVIESVATVVEVTGEPLHAAVNITTASARTKEVICLTRMMISS
jgi:hypothetical protein